MLENSNFYKNNKAKRNSLIRERGGGFSSSDGVATDALDIDRKPLLDDERMCVVRLVEVFDSLFPLFPGEEIAFAKQFYHKDEETVKRDERSRVIWRG